MRTDRPMYRRTATLALFLIMLSVSPPAYSQTNQVVGRHTAVIERLSGTVEVKAAGSSSWTGARRGMQVRTGDRIRVGTPGTCRLRISDVGVVDLDPGTQVRVGDLDQVRTIARAFFVFSRHITRDDVNFDLEAGESRQHFNRLPGRVGNYEVQTPVAVAGVRGTTFGLDLEGGDRWWEEGGFPEDRGQGAGWELDCTVKEGEVGLAGSGGAWERTITSGQTLHVRQDEVPGNPSAADSDVLNPLNDLVEGVRNEEEARRSLDELFEAYRNRSHGGVISRISPDFTGVTADGTAIDHSDLARILSEDFAAADNVTFNYSISEINTRPNSEVEVNIRWSATLRSGTNNTQRILSGKTSTLLLDPADYRVREWLGDSPFGIAASLEPAAPSSEALTASVTGALDNLFAAYRAKNTSSFMGGIGASFDGVDADGSSLDGSGLEAALGRDFGGLNVDDFSYALSTVSDLAGGGVEAHISWTGRYSASAGEGQTVLSGASTLELGDGDNKLVRWSGDSPFGVYDTLDLSEFDPETMIRDLMTAFFDAYSSEDAAGMLSLIADGFIGIDAEGSSHDRNALDAALAEDFEILDPSSIDFSLGNISEGEDGRYIVSLNWTATFVSPEIEEEYSFSGSNVSVTIDPEELLISGWNGAAPFGVSGEVAGDIMRARAEALLDGFFEAYRAGDAAGAVSMVDPSFTGEDQSGSPLDAQMLEEALNADFENLEVSSFNYTVNEMENLGEEIDLAISWTGSYWSPLTDDAGTLSSDESHIVINAEDYTLGRWTGNSPFGAWSAIRPPAAGAEEAVATLFETIRSQDLYGALNLIDPSFTGQNYSEEAIDLAGVEEDLSGDFETTEITELSYTILNSTDNGDAGFDLEINWTASLFSPDQAADMTITGTATLNFSPDELLLTRWTGTSFVGASDYFSPWNTPDIWVAGALDDLGAAYEVEDVNAFMEFVSYDFSGTDESGTSLDYNTLWTTIDQDFLIIDYPEFDVTVDAVTPYEDINRLQVDIVFNERFDWTSTGTEELRTSKNATLYFEEDADNPGNLLLVSWEGDPVFGLVDPLTLDTTSAVCDAHWTTDQTLTEDLYIGAGCQVLIDPGVTVTVDGPYGIYVEGTLNASFVDFTGSGGPGSWSGLFFAPGSAGSLDNCTVSNADMGITVDGASPTVDFFTVSDFTTSGITVEGGGAPTFTNGTISGGPGSNFEYIHIDGASPSFTGVSVPVSGADVSVHLEGSGTPYISNSTFDGGYGVQVDAFTGSAIFDGCTIQNSTDDGIEVMGGSSGSVTFSNCNISSNTEEGIEIGSLSSTTVSLSNTTISSNGFTGVYLVAGTSGVIDLAGGNTISSNGATDDIITMDGGSLTGSGFNTLDGPTTGDGIIFSGDASASFTGTLDISNCDGGIEMFSTGNVDIDGGSISSVTTEAVFCQGSGTLDLYGFSIDGDVDLSTFTGTAIFDNCVLSNSSGAGIEVYGGSGGTLQLTNTTVSNAASNGINVDITSTTTVDLAGGNAISLNAAASPAIYMGGGTLSGSGANSVSDASTSSGIMFDNGAGANYTGTSLTISNCSLGVNITSGGNITLDGLDVGFSGLDGLYINSATSVSVANGMLDSNGGWGVNIISGYAGTVTLSNTSVSSNSIGGIYFEDGTLSLSNCTVDGNTGPNLQINSTGGGSVTATNTTFDGSTTSEGILVMNGTLSMNGGSASNNAVEGIDISGGGAPTIQNAFIQNNGSNGVLFGIPSTLTLDGCTINGNTNDQINITNGNLVLDNSTVDGGTLNLCVNFSGGGTISMDGTTLQNSSVSGLDISNAGNVTLSNCTIQNNAADGVFSSGGYAGTLTFNGGNTVTMNTFAGLSTGGGSLAINGPDDFSGNISANIALAATLGSVTNFSNVTADNASGGSGLQVSGGLTFTINGGSFSGNSADGIEINAVAADVTVAGSTCQTNTNAGVEVIDATAVTIGGGASLDNNTGYGLKIQNGAITVNQATFDGNATGIDMWGGSLTINTTAPAVSISSNTGDGLLMNSAGLTITMNNVNIDNNVGPGLNVPGPSCGTVSLIGCYVSDNNGQIGPFVPTDGCYSDTFQVPNQVNFTSASGVPN